MQLPQNQIQVVSTDNQVVAGCKGSLSLRLVLDFATNAQYDINLQNIQALKIFDHCQTIFVDNQTGANIVITIGTSGQVIVAKANTQGYYNAIVPDPITMVITSAGGGITTIFLINVPIPGAVWSTV